MKALLLLAALACAEVREIGSMAELEPELTAGTLLVFDVDNTLLEPVGNLYSDQWAYYVEKAYLREGFSEEEAARKLGEAWTEGLKRAKVKPVETLTPALVAKARKAGLRVMALTARGPEDEAATRRHFKDAGYDIADVVFVGDGPDKGQALLAELARKKLKPARVVFADDKPKHAKNVDRALTAAGIPVIAFRYGAADAKVDAFNEVMAEADTPEKAALLFHGRFPETKPQP